MAGDITYRPGLAFQCRMLLCTYSPILSACRGTISVYFELF